MNANCVGACGYPHLGTSSVYAARDHSFATSALRLRPTRNRRHADEHLEPTARPPCILGTVDIPTGDGASPRRRSCRRRPRSNLNTAGALRQTRSVPIYHQFGRQYPGEDAAAHFPAKPYWPSNTTQFGVYPVRAPH